MSSINVLYKALVSSNNNRKLPKPDGLMTDSLTHLMTRLFIQQPLALPGSAKKCKYIKFKDFFRTILPMNILTALCAMLESIYDKYSYSLKLMTKNISTNLNLTGLHMRVPQYLHL